MRKIISAVAAAAAIALVAPAFGQGTYPDRPVKIVVGVPPGQTTDVLARLLAQELTQSTGQQFFVENKAGAGATLAPEAIARARPDGYTLMVTSAGPLAISPALQRKLPYDPLKDFAAIVNAFNLPLFLVANKDVAANNVQDLIAYAKANPGKLNYASTGTGTTGHLAMELFKANASVDLLHVPYRGAPAAMTDLLGGLVQLTFDFGPVVLPQVASGKIKAIGLASTQRSPAAPAIPTLSEQGMTGFTAGTFIAMFAPAGTPKDIVSRLNAEVNKALAVPDVRSAVERRAAEVAGGTPQELDALVQREHAMWGKLIRDAGIKGE